MSGFSKYSSKTTKKDEINYEIVQHFGKLTDEPDSFNKELNLVSWNGGEPKFDIRPWKNSPEKGLQMGKGITLTAEEIETLYEILTKIKNEGEE